MLICTSPAVHAALLIPLRPRGPAKGDHFFISSVHLIYQVVPPKEITAESIAADKEKKKFRAHKLSGQVRDVAEIRPGSVPEMLDGCRRDVAEIWSRHARCDLDAWRPRGVSLRRCRASTPSPRDRGASDEIRSA